MADVWEALARARTKTEEAGDEIENAGIAAQKMIDRIAELEDAIRSLPEYPDSQHEWSGECRLSVDTWDDIQRIRDMAGKETGE